MDHCRQISVSGKYMGAATCFSQGYRQVALSFISEDCGLQNVCFSGVLWLTSNIRNSLNLFVEKLPELQEMITAKYMYVEESLDKKLQV